MTRRSHRRAETAPFTVRLSPAERAAVDEKAAAAGVKVSEFAREALALYARTTGAGRSELAEEITEDGRAERNTQPSDRANGKRLDVVYDE